MLGETVRSSLCPYLSSCESGGGPSRMKGSSGGGGVDTGVRGEEVPLENVVISLTGEEAIPLLLRGGNLDPNVGDSTLHTFGEVVVVITVEILRFFDVLSNGVIVLCLEGRVGDGVFFVFFEELLPLLLRFLFDFLLCDEL